MPRIQVESPFLTDLFQRGMLAGSSRADILADPYFCFFKERCPDRAFLFSDIPDKHFREPKQIIHLSLRYTAGGVKS